MPDLEEYLDRPLTPPSTTTAEIDPALALRRDDLDRLLDPEPLAAETGWCWLPDGVAYVAARTEMPQVTGEMVDWWFDWHAREPIRYRIWHPPGHESNRVELPATPGAKKHWNTIHHPREDVGTGMENVRIEFVPPTAIGFSTDALDDPRVATIVCGYPGDDTRRLRHSVMVHVWLNTDAGTVLRSHFWLGSVIRPYAIGTGPLLNNRVVRRLALPRSLPEGLANHCLEEYANLAALLPELHPRLA